MLCKDGKGRAYPGSDSGYVMEPKLDGWRFLFQVTPQGEVVATKGRNEKDATGQAPPIEAIVGLLPADTIIDCEVVVLGEKSPRVAHELAHGGANLDAFVFDVLRVCGEDTHRKPYWERRQLLEKLAELFVNPVHLTPSLPADVETHEKWVADGLEGSVVKYEQSTYSFGAKSPAWVKFKPQADADAIVIGFEQGTGGWANGLGAFKLRLPSGYETTCAIPTKELRAEVTADPDSFMDRIIEIHHHGEEKSGAVRHPVFSRFREDLETNHEEDTMAEKPLAAPTSPKENTFEEFIGRSPIRSGTGRIRNVGQMSDDKLRGIVGQMKGYDEADPEGYATVMAEAARRELVLVGG
jgi:ATP-dependent DNA ligase